MHKLNCTSTIETSSIQEYLGVRLTSYHDVRK